MIKRIIFLGAPGVGKGTMAGKLSHDKGFIHVSTGEIFRNEIKEETTLGKKIKQILASGAYVSDEVTNEVVAKTLDNENVKNSGYLLDGYPRTLDQAKFLDSISQVDKVVLLVTDDNLVISRLMSRGRKDDVLEVIEKRIKIYNDMTKPLIDYYRSKGILVEVDSSNGIDNNYQKLLSSLEF